MSSNQYLDISIASTLKKQENYQKEQYGSTVIHQDDIDQDSKKPTVYLLGCNDVRGNYEDPSRLEIPHTKRIREVFYRYFDWNDEDLQIVDLGDVKTGLNIQDTKAALKEVLDDLDLTDKNQQKMIILFGGSADIISSAYQAYKNDKTDITVINPILPILPNNPIASKSYLLDMLLEEESRLKHYTHLAFQSYLNSVELLTNLDKFSFENLRLGQVREDIDQQEPFFRSTDLVSLDINALAPTAYPMFHQSPNGLTGEEACRLMQFAGMSTRTNVVHLAGYDMRKDIYNYYAMSMAQMIWYALDGFMRYPQDIEPSEQNKELFDNFVTEFADYTITFLKSKYSNRWWMTGANKEYIACNYHDYQEAINNKVSEKWLRSINK